MIGPLSTCIPSNVLNAFHYRTAHLGIVIANTNTSVFLYIHHHFTTVLHTYIAFFLFYSFFTRLTRRLFTFLQSLATSSWILLPFSLFTSFRFLPTSHSYSLSLTKRGLAHSLLTFLITRLFNADTRLLCLMDTFLPLFSFRLSLRTCLSM